MRFTKIITTITIMLLPILLMAQKQVTFTEQLIDSVAAGDDKAIADIDNDGLKDLILGGHKFSWYRQENGQFIKYRITEPIKEFSTDMRTGDMDQDGDIDLIVGDGPGNNNLMWYENPLPAKSPLNNNGVWKKHIIGSNIQWVHNLAIGDVNKDKLLDVVTGGHGAMTLWLNMGNDRWQQINLSAYGGGSVELYDIDSDGDLDIVTTIGWIECPADAFTQEWKFHPIHGLHAETVVAGDIDNDGKADIVAADSAHARGKLYLFKMTKGPFDSVWTKTMICDNCGSHKLQIGDFNNDGHPDILFGLELQYLGILYQHPKKPDTFIRQVILPKGGHNAMADDIDNDGDLDIISCDYLDHPPLRLFINNGISGKKRKGKH